MTDQDEVPAPQGRTRGRWQWQPTMRWFAAEYVIVVTGVLTAVAIDAAWANWQTRERSERFTDRLAEDVRYEAWGYEFLLQYYDDVFANAQAAVTGMTDRSMSDEEFLIAAYRATQYSYNERRRTTFDELVSTGEIGLISDDVLRATAVGLFVSSNQLIEDIREEGVNSEYRRIFRRIVPADAQRALPGPCGDRLPPPGDYAGIVDSLDYPCTLDLAPDRIAAAAAVLRSDPSVLPALQLRLADVETTLINLRLNLPAMGGNLRRVAGRVR